MPAPVNVNYSANFQKFVDFADNAYATKGAKGGDTVLRFTGAPSGDYKGSFASFRRTAEMKTANDRVRDSFLKTVADMFGGEKFIPDLVRDNMKLEDFGKGKPLTARRIKLVSTAIKMLGGGKFQDAAGISKATSMGYVASEIPKLARVANIYQQATGCTDAEAEAAALDPGSKARRLFDCGGRFTLNAENFRKGLELLSQADAAAREGLQANGIDPSGLGAVDFAFSTDHSTGDVTIRFSSPREQPFAFEWTSTIRSDGTVTTTPFRFMDETTLKGLVDAAAGAIKSRIIDGAKDAEARSRAVDMLLERARTDADLLYLLGYGQCATASGILLDYSNSLRSDEEIAKRLDAIRGNLNELRTAAKGDARTIKGLLPQFINLGGKALKPGVLAKMFEAAANVDLAPLLNLSVDSSPKTLAEAMCAVEKGVARLVDASNAYEGKGSLGVDDVVAVNGLAMGILFSRCDDNTLRGLKTAFRSENAAKVAHAFERFHRSKFPAGTNAPENVRSAVTVFSRMLRSTWALRMDALMAVDDMLGVAFDNDSDYVSNIPESEFNDVYNVIENHVRETHQGLIDRQARRT